MKTITSNAELVAYCGLYCGACGKYLKEKCLGCHQNEKATWCTVRSCCIERKYTTCAECSEYPDARDCGKFNNFMSKLIGILLRSDRSACIKQIKQLGVEGHAKNMAQNKRQTIRR